MAAAPPALHHTLSVVVENKFGVLARVSGMFARRGYNIFSLAVAPTDDERFSRITIVVDAEQTSVEQMVKQLFKLINVVKVTELGPSESVERELLLLTLRANATERGQVIELLQQGTEPVSLDSRVGPEGESELGDIVADVLSPSPFDVVTEAMLGSEIEKLLSTLDTREREILRLRFGLDRGDPRTLEEVGNELNLTRERIRQIERAALSKLRHPSAKTDSRSLLAS